MKKLLLMAALAAGIPAAAYAAQALKHTAHAPQVTWITVDGEAVSRAAAALRAA